MGMGAILYFDLAHDAPKRYGATASKIDKGLELFAPLMAFAPFMACTTIVVVITLGQNVLLDAYWNASVLMAAWKCCGDSHSATLTNRNFAFGSKLS